MAYTPNNELHHCQASYSPDNTVHFGDCQDSISAELVLSSVLTALPLTGQGLSVTTNPPLTLAASLSAYFSLTSAGLALASTPALTIAGEITGLTVTGAGLRAQAEPAPSLELAVAIPSTLATSATGLVLHSYLAPILTLDGLLPTPLPISGSGLNLLSLSGYTSALDAALPNALTLITTGNKADNEIRFGRNTYTPDNVVYLHEGANLTLKSDPPPVLTVAVAMETLAVTGDGIELNAQQAHSTLAITGEIDSLPVTASGLVLFHGTAVILAAILPAYLSLTTAATSPFVKRGVSVHSVSNIWRGVQAQKTAVYSKPGYTQVSQQQLWARTQSTATAAKVKYLQTLPISIHRPSFYTSNVNQSTSVQRQACVRWLTGKPLAERKPMLWNPLHSASQRARIGYSLSYPLKLCCHQVYLPSLITHQRERILWGGGAKAHRDHYLIYAQTVALKQRKRGLYNEALPLIPGAHPRAPIYYPPVPPDPDCNNCGCGQVYTRKVNAIQVGCPVPTNNELHFRNPPCYLLTVPDSRVYFMTNSFSLVRVDNNAPLYAISFSLSIGADSWTWSWNAKVAGKQITDVLTIDVENPIEVVATINGTAFKLLIENVTRDRSFNSDVISLTGRGISAYLAAPYAPISTVFSSAELTASQATELALQLNGVSIGWDVGWNLTDWLIAANAFSSTGTYIEHLQRIAEAGGGYIQSDKMLQKVWICPYYPIAPWTWATQTPALVLPESAFITEGIQYSSKTVYNGVYITGSSSGGRQDLIMRSGTAGDILAPTIVDPLATATEMTTQRGLRVLGDTGVITMITLKLPIFQQTGIILPGTMLKYTICGVVKIGIVRSTTVNYAIPVVDQTIEIESHEYL